jgi:hypothetical protein
MEQQLDATYLRPCFVSKAIALSVAAVGFGTSFLRAAFGISLFWRPTLIPTTLDIRIANPEVIVRQEKPFLVAPPETLNAYLQGPNNRPEQSSNLEPRKGVGDPVTPAQEVIQQEVIVFSSVKHSDGSIVTGWKYPNGGGHVPSSQFCYFSSPNADKSTKRVDIAVNGTPLSETALALVPESEDALKKCQWWRA